MSLERVLITDNILDRIAELERRLRELETGSVTVQVVQVPEAEGTTSSALNGWIATGTAFISPDGRIVLDASLPGIKIGAGGLIYSADYVAGQAGFKIDGGIAEFNNVTIRGTVHASAGSIGGWTITSGHLYAGSGSSRTGLRPADYPFYAGAENPASAPFRVTSSGALTATNATITGTITANAGSIGGWTIASGHLYAGSGSTRCGLRPADYPFYAGAENPASAPFRVTPSGALTATNATITGTVTANAGSIGGWTITSGQIYATNLRLYSGAVGTARVEAGTGTDANTGGLAATSAASDVAFWAGATFANRASAPFRVTSSGALTATNATVTGTIYASAGHFSGTVNVGTSAPYIQIDGANKRIRTSTYSVGLQGFNLDGVTGNAEFNNVDIRGALKASVFEYSQMFVTGGTLIVAKGAGKLYADCTSVDAPNTFNVDIEDPDGLSHSAAGDLWAIGDIIRLKDALVGDLWAKVTNKVDMTTYWRLVVEKQSPGAGTNYTFRRGMAVVNYGQSGQGFLMMTADQSNAPFYSVRTHAGAPWQEQTELIRIGNLAGTGLSGYGILIGDIASGQYLSYSPGSGLVVSGRGRNSLVNNFSVTGSTAGWYEGWSGGSPCNRPIVQEVYKDGVLVKTLKVETDGNVQIISDFIEIDPTCTYEVRLSIYSNHPDDTGWRYFGIFAYDGNKTRIAVTPFIVSTRSWGSPTSNPYFWYGDVYGGQWRDMVGYVLGCNTTADEVPQGRNVDRHFRLPPNAKYITVRFLNYYNGGVTVRNDFYSPQVIPVGTTRIHGDLIVDGTIRAEKLNVDTLEAITVNTGSLTISGVLSIGTAGGIYQGTGTFGSPVDGLKIYNDGGQGTIATYKDGQLRVTLSPMGLRIKTEYYYVEAGSIRFWVDNYNGKPVRQDPYSPEGVASIGRFWAKAGPLGQVTVGIDALSCQYYDAGTWKTAQGVLELSAQYLTDYSYIGIYGQYDATGQYGISLIPREGLKTRVHSTLDVEGNITTTANFQAIRAGTTYTGYIYVPLANLLTHPSLDGDALAVGTYTIGPVGSGANFEFNYPAAAKALMVRIVARWSSAGNYYVGAKHPDGNHATVMAWAHAANIWDNDVGPVATDSTGKITLLVYGANTSNTWVLIAGYFI